MDDHERERWLLAIAYKHGVLDAVGGQQRIQWMTQVAFALGGLALGLGVASLCERVIGSWMLIGVTIVLWVTHFWLNRVERRRWLRVLELGDYALKYARESAETQNHD